MASSSSSSRHSFGLLLVSSLLHLLALRTSATSPTFFAYQAFCSAILPPAGSPPATPLPDLSFHQGHFSGGAPIFNAPFAGRTRIRLSITPQTELATHANRQEHGYDVVDGFVALRERHRSTWSGSVKGVWIVQSEQLCMAACLHNPQINDQVDCQVKLSFHYPAKASITQPVVRGKLESQRNRSDPLFFEPIVAVAVLDRPYVFNNDTDQLRAVCASQDRNVPARIEVLRDESAACEQFVSVTQFFEIEGPHRSGGSNRESQEQLLLRQKTECRQGLVRGYFTFANTALQQETTQGVLAFEGQWDSSRGQFCMAACSLFTGDSLTVDPPDCDIVITLQFPTTVDLFFRYSLVGHAKKRSGRNSASSSSFYPFDFRQTIQDARLGSRELKYSYTSEMLQQAQSKCEAAGAAGDKEQSEKQSPQSAYPDGSVFSDLRFWASVKGEEDRLYFNPLSIDGRIAMLGHRGGEVEPLLSPWQDSINVSFEVRDAPTSSKHLVSAEGVYNRTTGLLCLIACRTIDFPAPQNATEGDGAGQDCQIHATIQYPRIHPSSPAQDGMIRGQIVSLRKHSDPLFFAPMTLSDHEKVYRQQVVAFLRQIDSDFVIAFISLTMAAVFVGAQLRHANRRPVILPHVSLLMLSVLTLGYLTLLVSDSNAIVPQRMWTRIWESVEDELLKLPEMLMRIMAMAVCLLLFRLLGLARRSKAAMSTAEGPWHMERRVLYVCLAAYVSGAIIAGIVSAVRGDITLLRVMRAYAEMTVDFFLFPQVVANCVWRVEDRVLSPPFYFGMTLLRSFPHLYDILRRISRFAPRLLFSSSSYSYDLFYSSAADAIIPCGALLLAVLVFCQQRYGGYCILPRRCREKPMYEMVSMSPAS